MKLINLMVRQQSSKRFDRKQNQEPGVILVLTALTITLMLACLAAVVDFGLITNGQTRLNHTASHAVLAGLKVALEKIKDPKRDELALAAVNNILTSYDNTVLGLLGNRLEPVALSTSYDSDIIGGIFELGSFHRDQDYCKTKKSAATPCFMPLGSDKKALNAARIRVKTSPNNPILTFIAGVMGLDGVQIGSEQTATFLKKKILLLVDMSPSIVEEKHDFTSDFDISSTDELPHPFAFSTDAVKDGEDSLNSEGDCSVTATAEGFLYCKLAYYCPARTDPDPRPECDDDFFADDYKPFPTYDGVEFYVDSYAGRDGGKPNPEPLGQVMDSVLESLKISENFGTHGDEFAVMGFDHEIPIKPDCDNEEYCAGYRRVNFTNDIEFVESIVNIKNRDLFDVVGGVWVQTQSKAPGELNFIDLGLFPTYGRYTWIQGAIEKGIEYLKEKKEAYTQYNMLFVSDFISTCVRDPISQACPEWNYCVGANISKCFNECYPNTNGQIQCKNSFWAFEKSTEMIEQGYASYPPGSAIPPDEEAGELSLKSFIAKSDVRIVTVPVGKSIGPGWKILSSGYTGYSQAWQFYRDFREAIAMGKEVKDLVPSGGGEALWDLKGKPYASQYHHDGVAHFYSPNRLAANLGLVYSNGNYCPLAHGNTEDHYTCIADTDNPFNPGTSGSPPRRVESVPAAIHNFLYDIYCRSKSQQISDCFLNNILDTDAYILVKELPLG